MIDGETVELLVNEKDINKKIAILLAKHLTHDMIAKILHVSSKTISNVKKSLDNSGEIPLRKKTGRPTIQTAEIITIVIEETINNPRVPAGAIQVSIALRAGRTVSITTIQNIRREAGFYYSPPRSAPSLTPLQIQKRLSFCYSILKHPEIIPFFGFSDESRFCMQNDKRWVWVKRGDYNDKAYVQKSKFPVSIMVWGMIGYQFKSKLLFIDNTLTAQGYVNMLFENAIIEDAISVFGENFKFQQDGATSHTAKSTREALTKKCDIVINWPPNSPDLNVIEMIWAIMKNVLAEMRPQNVADFKNCVTQVWNQIALDTTINHLVASFRTRCFLCLQNGGKCISHLIKRDMFQPTNEQIAELFATCEDAGMILQEIPLFAPKN